MWQFPEEDIFHQSELLQCFQDDHVGVFYWYKLASALKMLQVKKCNLAVKLIYRCNLADLQLNGHIRQR